MAELYDDMKSAPIKIAALICRKLSRVEPMQSASATMGKNFMMNFLKGGGKFEFFIFGLRDAGTM